MSRPDVLLIDDEEHIADVVVYALQENGFRMDIAFDGDSGLALFRDRGHDLVILDLVLPGISGLDLFHALRRCRSDVPIIMLTSRTDEVDRVLGLEMGADDYVTKPFSPRELVARVKAVLRRARPGREPAAILHHGPLTLNRETHTLTCDNEQIMLTHGEFGLMQAFIEYPARVFEREALINRIYDEAHPVTERIIDAYIKRLRRKCQDVRPDLNIIQTVYGVGYRLHPDLDHGGVS